MLLVETKKKKKKLEGFSHESCALKATASVIRADLKKNNVSTGSFQWKRAWSGANTMSIIQLLRASAFGVRMLCNLAELAVTICITRTLELSLGLAIYPSIYLSICWLGVEEGPSLQLKWKHSITAPFFCVCNRILKPSTLNSNASPPVVGVVSEKTLSSCNTAAYLSEALEPLTGGAVVVAWPTPPGCCWCCWCCCWDRDWGRGCAWGWFRPPKSTLRDLGKALKGPVAPEADIVRPGSQRNRLIFSVKTGRCNVWFAIWCLQNLKDQHQLILFPPKLFEEVKNEPRAEQQSI